MRKLGWIMLSMMLAVAGKIYAAQEWATLMVPPELQGEFSDGKMITLGVPIKKAACGRYLYRHSSGKTFYAMGNQSGKKVASGTYKIKGSLRSALNWCEKPEEKMVTTSTGTHKAIVYPAAYEGWVWLIQVPVRRPSPVDYRRFPSRR